MVPMVFDIAVIALSLAALAYVGRSLMRARPGLAEGAVDAYRDEVLEGPDDGQTLGLLRSALTLRRREPTDEAAAPEVAPGDQDPTPAPRAAAPPAEEHDAGSDSASAAGDDVPAEPAAPASADAPAPEVPKEVLIDICGPGAPEVEVVDLSDPEEVLALEFAEDPTGHLHLLHGRAEAEIEDGIARTAWLDVYLSRSDWLDRRDLDAAGEFPETLASHLLRIDLGRTVTRPDGTVTGAINEDPELYFDREIASEIDFSV
ncbi:hypothetical protein EAT49_04350 [Histidinibacterium lentulum]|uniref:Uncharacterized protein n=2 Tax=Histidinibacterium lentulum TaxID=2480588 RepID=A0A3N2R7W1_9RHOB|nr:hypothetical protein EAT49_04350 [Histidinibacterium lentulum]